MFFYIVASGVYRLSCGALILAINWMIAVDHQSFKWLAILIALTFLPAIVVPLVWKNDHKQSGRVVTGICLILAALLAAGLYISQNLYFLLVMNTILWLFFFVMESSWESWFAKLIKQCKENRVDRYSSLSMSVNQACLMIGPIIVGFVFRNQPQSVFIIAAILFLCTGLYTLFLTNRQSTDSVTSNTAEKNNTRKAVINLTGYEISLILIWPTLAVFNFMLPVQVIFNHGTMADVGILDAVMGLGMIVAGGLMGNTLSGRYFSRYYITLPMIIVACIIWLTDSGLIAKSCAIFMLGVVFNIARIKIRSYLARKYPSAVVGALVAKANALSFFIIGITLFLFHNNLQINWAIPFIFTAVICVLSGIKAETITTIAKIDS